MKTFFALIEIKNPLKILSVSCLYKPASSIGKAFAWLYKDKDVEHFQNCIIEKASQTELVNVTSDLRNIDHIDVDFIFLLDKNINKRDTTNFLKIVEDALMQVTKIDDSKHRRVTACKAPSLIKDTEYIICSYKVFYED